MGGVTAARNPAAPHTRKPCRSLPSKPRPNSRAHYSFKACLRCFLRSSWHRSKIPSQGEQRPTMTRPCHAKNNFRTRKCLYFMRCRMIPEVHSLHGPGATGGSWRVLFQPGDRSWRAPVRACLRTKHLSIVLFSKTHDHALVYPADGAPFCHPAAALPGGPGLPPGLLRAPPARGAGAARWTTQIR